MREEESVFRVFFIYEALTDSQKEAIDREIRKDLEKMVLSNKGFDYTSEQIASVIYGLILFNREISKLLGDNSPSYFSLKETIIKSRAYKIAYELECSRPSLFEIEEYIELCKLLSVEPSIEALFSSEYTEEKIFTFRYYIENKKTEKAFEGIVDKFHPNSYNISSNIKSFECLAQSFYDLE